ncbi:hypothetical protein SAMN05444157_2822 [Frankineae bacterium MT45]|nr:hypothetical protein SAMN05444157_2822 [Frankineae bacterium MT45]
MPRCARSERLGSGSVAGVSDLVERVSGEYAWAIWLAAPLVVVLLASIWIWWRGRARGVPAAGAAIKAHHKYLDTLSAVAAGAAPAAPVGESLNQPVLQPSAGSPLSAGSAESRGDSGSEPSPEQDAEAAAGIAPEPANQVTLESSS